MRYGSLREKISAERIERQQRYNEYARLWDAAHKAGIDAGTALVPEPMHINGYAPIADGMCGFAWIVTHPGNSSFARWAVKCRSARKEYGGGVCLRWVGEFNQSHARKVAYAKAFAKVLRDGGLDATACERLD
jgi:hypothetical protein